MLVPPASVQLQLATVDRLDGLLLGALAAWIFRQPALLQKLRRWLPWLAIAGIGLFFCGFTAMLVFPQTISQWMYGGANYLGHSVEEVTGVYALYGGYSLLAIGYSALVLYSAVNEGRKSPGQALLRSRILAPIGKYSYGIYVFHVPVLGLGNVFLLPRFYGTAHDMTDLTIMMFCYALLLVMASIALAAISYELFEKRFLRLKRYFEPHYDAREPIAVGGAVRNE